MGKDILPKRSYFQPCDQPNSTYDEDKLLNSHLADIRKHSADHRLVERPSSKNSKGSLVSGVSDQPSEEINIGHLRISDLLL